MRKSETITTQLGIYIIEEQSFLSRGAILHKYVRVFCDPKLRVDITDIVAKICGYTISKHHKTLGMILNCQGFYQSDHVCESIKKHSHEIANTAQPTMFRAYLKTGKERV